MSKNQDPFVKDKNDPAYTPLNEFLEGRRWRLSGMIGDAGFALNVTPDTLIPTGNVSNQSIKVGDIVGLGNIRGEVTKIYESTEEPGRVVGLQVNCSTPYLPIDYKDNHEAYGYDTPESRVINILLEKEGNGGPGTSDTPDASELKNFIIDGSTTATVTYLGDIVVFEKHTDDPNTWSRTEQDAKVLEDRK